MSTTDPFTALLARIRSGYYPAGGWLDPERDLARDLGVHRNTVRRAVARLVELGYLDRQKGCRPVVKTSDVARQQVRTITLLMGNEPRFHAFQAVLRGCGDDLLAAGYRLAFRDTYGKTDAATQRRERLALEGLVRQPVEGVIVWCQSPAHTAPYLAELMSVGTRVVLIDRCVPGIDADYVGVDNVDASCDAVKHLISMGHRRIALMTWIDEASAVLEREEGYRKAMNSHGLAVDELLIYRLNGDLHEAAVQQAAEDIARRPDRPTAVFAINDIIAFYLFNALRDLGLAVPRDVALVGFDDIEALTALAPFLTTVHQPYEAVGQCAVRLLLERIAAPDAPTRHVLLPTSLVVRASSRPSVSPSGADTAGAPEHPLSTPDRHIAVPSGPRYHPV